ncbi:3-oxoacyl-ACP synthase [Actinoplanes sp. TBRC 11911]|uniref:ketoacyl-ACP synthase III family protein n=1 Tax=Actinoplanes sp. TBRC 11911 TaxID=2729386 RepID=UPI00145FCDE6|nr:ketoacyl-ACP synthase III family protein [Actinoplanes sp. TBRC 11911]NMO53350.1 3-oxoacyl-ACP synthase [Actinoplanes sp. TBRC 11911]
MTAIEAVSAYLPPARVPITELAAELGLSDRQAALYRRYYGLDTVCLDPGGTLTDLMLGAAGKLDALRGREHQVRYVIQARTLECPPYPVNPVHDVRDALGLRHAAAFTVMQHACASGLLAVDLAGRLLAAGGDPDGLALLFVGEKAFTPIARQIPGTTVMGEGSAAVLIRHGGTRDRVVSYATRSHGRFSDGLLLTGPAAEEFELRYLDALAEVIQAATSHAGVSPSELSLVLPHNVNRLSWIRLARRIGLPVDRVLLDNVPLTGHCFGADPFINYATAIELGRLRAGDHYLMAAVGLGATFSAMVLQH